MTTPLYEMVISYMDEADRHYQVNAEGGLIVAEITGDHGSWHTFIQVTDEDEERKVVIHALLPVRISDCNRLNVAELLTKINYDLIVGNFELGFENGEVLFKTTLDLADGQITQAMFERMYNLNTLTMNEHYGQILSAGYAGGDHAISTAENLPEGVMLQ